ncbi:hypothetical protein HHK36_000083 [Tetracentron sinense]|uniref:DUF7356 domain-containing protein n=1 Tax=Tetracentron sinense TaxID=13715 RepID=A0A835DTP5_TETSI|nr:hypothetical protein HHK36_000083 [Tetracentron sinense]
MRLGFSCTGKKVASRKMERSRLFLLIFALSLLVIDCSDTELEVKKSKGLNDKLDGNSFLSSNDNNGGSKSVVDPLKDEQEKKDEEKKGAIKNDPGKNNSSKQLPLEETPKDGTNKESPGKGESKKKTSKEDSESKVVPKKGNKEVGSVHSNPLRKESFQGEDCGSSNTSTCTDEKNNLTACLRVPGDESQEHSLFIQYKGKGPLTVMISAPDFVQLENKTVQFQKKEDKKVKVSIGEVGNETVILLKAGKGLCNLDFSDLVRQNSVEKTGFSPQPTDIKPPIRTSSIVYISFGALLVLASAWMYVRFRRRHLPSNGARYQKLPVSSVRKTDSYVTNGWDNSWGDSWDDEEAPKTPAIPVTPSLSSKGLASRRFSKEGRKD